MAMADGSASPAVEPWAWELVRRIEGEALLSLLACDSYLALPFKLHEVSTGRAVLERSPAERAAIAAAAFVLLQQYHTSGIELPAPDLVPKDADRVRLHQYRGHVDYAIVHRLLQPRLPLPEDCLVYMMRYAAAAYGRHYGVPIYQIFQQFGHAAGGRALEGPLQEAVCRYVEAVRKSKHHWSERDRDNLLEAAERLLAGKKKSPPRLVGTAWADRVLAEIAALAEPEAASANKAIALALTATGKSKPSRPFLSAAEGLLGNDPAAIERVLGWIEAHTPEPLAADPNDDCIRGLIWLLAAGDCESIAPRLAAYAELCFRKIPNAGARSVKLGNGVIQTLDLLGGTRAVSELVRLKRRLRYPSIVQKIEAALTALAARIGVSGEDLEEISVPTCGLATDGERRLTVGSGEAVLRLVGGREVELAWRRSDGRQVRAVPKELKALDPEGVKSARALRREIEGVLVGQLGRLESLWLTDRRIPIELWRARYFDHPLLAGLSRRLIWSFERSGNAVAGLPRHDEIQDPAGYALGLGDQTRVGLWHPLHHEADDVLRWRRRLAALGIVQPFKQAHREVYVLTDAERRTGTYSNRFAGHILKQHQFKALCDQRGWRFRLMGAWDSHNTPTRKLARYGLSIEYWVDMIDTAETTGSFVYTLISTDQVRFVDEGGRPVPLATVPPLVFSEAMRDVDLFAGVASVGNDPDWADGGPEGQFRDYWRKTAFGELTEASETRAAVLRDLLPRLAIADRCALDGRFLVVRGNVRTYRIHIGSGNIIMEPDGRYLCIVAARGTSAGKSGAPGLLLPFEGDGMLSLVLSKAFLLASDDRITDSTILSQIRA